MSLVGMLLRGLFTAGPDLVRGSRMGRGRQKAKHTKVARELKYFSPDTNYSQLERELGGGSSSPSDFDTDAWEEYASDEKTGAEADSDNVAQ